MLNSTPPDLLSVVCQRASAYHNTLPITTLYHEATSIPQQYKIY
jgi:hypothetical protein